MKKPSIVSRNYQCSTRRESKKKIALKLLVGRCLERSPSEGVLSLEKKIKTLKGLRL